MEKLSKIFWLLTIVFPNLCAAQPSTAADSLIGSWAMSATEHISINKVSKSQITQTTSRILCNTCPVVTFDSNGTGQVISANGLKQPFKWAVANNRLKVVKYTSKKAKPFSILRDSIYSIRISQHQLGGDVLKLLDTSATTYVLVKKYP
ncbi:hypothetical protein [Hymenobacter saemangeumensis]|uniref:hypothetical protein n=1 Tax=Hymenobacter saemangeumensis TaxID=1084522 RepID=UPI0031E5BC8B